MQILEDRLRLLKPVLTAEEMTEVDRFTIEEIGIPSLSLMENAGRAASETAQNMLRQGRGSRVVIACGKGNNGGDGFVIARCLFKAGFEVDVLLTAPETEISGDAATNFKILAELGITVKQYEKKAFVALISEADLVVDALLGTGVTGELRGKIAEIVNLVNQSETPVLAVDLPTGMNTDTGTISGVCIQASRTVTVGHLKRGLLFSPGRESAGGVRVADIGFPRKALSRLKSQVFRVTHDFVASTLPVRKANTYKNRQGQILVLAGSTGMTGAASLTASATLRSGAGLTILGCPESLNSIFEEKLTEVMTLPLAEENGELSFSAKNQITEKLNWANALAVGPGLGTGSEITELVSWLLKSFDGPLVLDADGLNCLAEKTDLFKKSKAQLVLTPHPGELARLMKKKSNEILADPIESAKEAAKLFNAVVVLKGAPSVTASPSGSVFINPTGNPGMATAGMGDVLTGVIAGLASQGISVLEAAICGVFLHGLAADLAKKKIGMAGLLASDVLNHLPKAILKYEQEPGTEIEFD